jgi:hypothetical protein
MPTIHREILQEDLTAAYKAKLEHTEEFLRLSQSAQKFDAELKKAKAE